VDHVQSQGAHRARHRRLFASACLAFCAGLALPGCYRATFIDPNAMHAVEHREWTDFFLFGLAGHERMDVRSYCTGPVALVRTGANVGTAVVSVLTIGIYTPRVLYVTCAAEARAVGRVQQP